MSHTLTLGHKAERSISCPCTRVSAINLATEANHLVFCSLLFLCYFQIYTFSFYLAHWITVCFSFFVPSVFFRPNWITDPEIRILTLQFNQMGLFPNPSYLWDTVIFALRTFAYRFSALPMLFFEAQFFLFHTSPNQANPYLSSSLIMCVFVLYT